MPPPALSSTATAAPFHHRHPHPPTPQPLTPFRANLDSNPVFTLKLRPAGSHLVVMPPSSARDAGARVDIHRRRGPFCAVSSRARVRRWRLPLLRPLSARPLPHISSVAGASERDGWGGWGHWGRSGSGIGASSTGGGDDGESGGEEERAAVSMEYSSPPRTRSVSAA